MNHKENKRKAMAMRLALARKQAGLSQAHVAQMMGLRRPAISEAESSRRNITADELTKLAKIYGVGVAWLACEDTDSADKLRDRVHLAARELAKLKEEDLDKVMGLLSALKK